MDPLLLDILKQSPILGVVFLMMRREDAKDRQFLSALREIQVTAREDAKELWSLIRTMQEETAKSLESASVALTRNADANGALERKLSDLGLPPGRGRETP